MIISIDFPRTRATGSGSHQATPKDAHRPAVRGAATTLDPAFRHTLTAARRPHRERGVSCYEIGRCCLWRPVTGRLADVNRL